MKYCYYLLLMSCFFMVSVGQAYNEQDVAFVKDWLANPGRRPGQIFENLDLSGADFSGCNFKRAFFYKVDLHGSVLNGANLAWCQFRELDAHSIKLIDAKLSSASFYNVDLSGADFTKAILSPFDAAKCLAECFDAHGRLIPKKTRERREPTHFNSVCLNDAIMCSLQAQETVWSDVAFIGTDFGSSVFDNATFTTIDVAKANFSDSCFNNVCFIDSSGFAYTNFNAAKSRVGANLSYPIDEAIKKYNVVFNADGIGYECKYLLNGFFGSGVSALVERNEDYHMGNSSSLPLCKNSTCFLCDKSFLSTELVEMFPCACCVHIDCAFIFKRNPYYFEKNPEFCPNENCGKCFNENAESCVIPYDSNVFFEHYGSLVPEDYFCSLSDDSESQGDGCSSDERSYSLDDNCCSPHESCYSLDEKSCFPYEGSYSPYEKSCFPYEGSYSPYEKSYSPDDVSYSPAASSDKTRVVSDQEASKQKTVSKHVSFVESDLAAVEHCYNQE